MNILIKLMSIVSLVIAPHIARPGNERGPAPAATQEAQPPVRWVRYVAPGAAPGQPAVWRLHQQST